MRWQDEGAGTRELPIRDVARIYLNTASARNTFNYREDRSGSGNNNTAAQDRARGSNRAFGANRNFAIVASDLPVRANVAWNDSRIDVMRGDRLRFDAQGDVTFIQGANNTINAGGKTDVMSQRYPVPSLGVGALIGKIGPNGTPFAIGSSRDPVTVPATGRLYLGVNDDNFADNAGAFSVTIMRGQ